MNSAEMILGADNMIKTSELTEDQERSIAKEIGTIAKNFLNPTITYETELAIRANVDGYVMGGDGKILAIDYPSLKEYMKQAFATFEKFTEFNIVSMYVYVLSKEAASCTFEFKGKYLTTKGETMIHNGCWTFVFKKFDNIWKVVQENGTHTH